MGEARAFESALNLAPASGDDGQNASPDDRVLGVFQDTIISTLHFRELKAESERRMAVKNGLRIIDVEIFSQCNRRCHYCSNSVLDRLSTNNFMDVDVYRGIVADLATVDWDGQFRFIGLNEPTMHREFLVARVREARAAIPRAALTVFSNGDYLTRDYLDELYDAGARVMYISVHLQRFMPFDDRKVIKRIGMLSRKLGLDFRIDTHVPGVSVVGAIPYRDMMIQIFQHDYEKIGHDRGGILDGIGRQDYERTSACTVPIQMMVISYNGNVLPCCHFVGDAEQHKGLVVGKLGGGRSLFDVYASPEYLSWRRDLFAIGPKGKECRKCVDYADFSAMQDSKWIAIADRRQDGLARPPSVRVAGGNDAGAPVEGMLRID